MNNRATILHFVVSCVLLFITLYFIALKYEDNDTNAASMYIVVYGFLPLAFWVASYFIIRASLFFLKRKGRELLAFMIPTIIFSIFIYLLDVNAKSILWALTIVSSVINFTFYFIHANKEL